MSTDDEAQARAYRAAVRRRAAARRSALRALSGDPAAARELEEAWAPLMDGLRDLEAGRSANGPGNT